VFLSLPQSDPFYWLRGESVEEFHMKLQRRQFKFGLVQTIEYHQSQWQWSWGTTLAHIMEWVTEIGPGWSCPKRRDLLNFFHRIRLVLAHDCCQSLILRLAWKFPIFIEWWFPFITAGIAENNDFVTRKLAFRVHPHRLCELGNRWEDEDDVLGFLKLLICRDNIGIQVLLINLRDVSYLCHCER
jgi:hypothetical protein